MDRRRPARYSTKQQEAIYAFLKTVNGGHVTAGQILEHMRSEGIPIGLTTIYRHLDKLVKSGKARKYTIDNLSCACYQLSHKEADCHAHYHLKCESCGALVHLQCDLLGEIYKHVTDEHNFKINSMKTVFYGRCDACLNDYGGNWL